MIQIIKGTFGYYNGRKVIPITEADGPQKFDDELEMCIRDRDYIDRVDAYQNRTYKIHGRPLLNLAAVLDELEPLPELRQ